LIDFKILTLKVPISFSRGKLKKVDSSSFDLLNIKKIDSYY